MSLRTKFAERGDTESPRANLGAFRSGDGCREDIEAPERTARMRLEIRQSWARQPAGLEGPAPSSLFLSQDSCRIDTGLGQFSDLPLPSRPLNDSVRDFINPQGLSISPSLSCQGFAARLIAVHESASVSVCQSNLAEDASTCRRIRRPELFAEQNACLA